jgi:uncharacterized protein DUF1707
VSLLVPQPPGRVRASDADREHTVAILQNGAVLGRITPDELSTRLDRAFGARTLGDLRALVADLPEGNVNPVSELIGGMVQTGYNIARVGLLVGVSVLLLAIFVPVIAGLAASGHGIAALVATGLMVALFVGLSMRFRRRPSRPGRSSYIRG